MVRYIYDAWGNHAIVDSNGEDVTEGRKGIEGIGILNPFRYRGYYYDTETGLYYLQTRYYDPEIGRFISQDSIDYADPETINGLNLYAYCNNDPVNKVDPTGTWSWKKFWAAVVFSLSVVAVVVGAALVILGVGAGVGGVLIAAGIGGLVGMGGSAISQGVSNGWDNIDWGVVAIDGAAGFATGALLASPLGPVATGALVGVVSFVQSAGTDLYKSNGNWNNVNWEKAVTFGVINGILAGVSKSFIKNTSLQSNFVNSLPWVKAASTAAYSGSRVAYMSLWKMLIFGQFLYQKGLTLITAAIRSGINAIIKNNW